MPILSLLGGMNENQRPDTLKDSVQVLAQNIAVNQKGQVRRILSALTGFSASLTAAIYEAGQTIKQVYPWNPGNTISGQYVTDGDTGIFVVFYEEAGVGKVKLVYRTAASTYTYSDLTPTLTTDFDTDNIIADCDIEQFVFVDGRTSNRAHRILISNLGVATIAPIGMSPIYAFATVTEVRYDSEDGVGTGIGQGSLFGYRYAFRNDFDEASPVSPITMFDLLDYQKKGVIAGAVYTPDAINHGSLEQIILSIPIPADAKYLDLYRCDAEGHETEIAMTPMRLVKSEYVKGASNPYLITDGYPYGLTPVNLLQDDAPKADFLALSNSSLFFSNAVNDINFPYDIAKLIRLYITNNNPQNFINGYIELDLYDETINAGVSGDHINIPIDDLAVTNYRFMDTDMITPLETYVNATDAVSYELAANTEVLTRKLVKVRIPEILAYSTKIIYLVIAGTTVGDATTTDTGILFNLENTSGIHLDTTKVETWTDQHDTKVFVTDGSLTYAPLIDAEHKAGFDTLTFGNIGAGNDYYRYLKNTILDAHAGCTGLTLSCVVNLLTNARILTTGGNYWTTLMCLYWYLGAIQGIVYGFQIMYGKKSGAVIDYTKLLIYACDKDANRSVLQEFTCPDLRDSAWHVITAVINYTAKTAEINLDGVSLGVVTGLTTWTDNSIDSPIYASLGATIEQCGTAYNYNGFCGKMAAARGYERALTTAEITSLTNYYKIKYGLYYTAMVTSVIPHEPILLDATALQTMYKNMPINPVKSYKTLIAQSEITPTNAGNDVLHNYPTGIEKRNKANLNFDSIDLPTQTDAFGEIKIPDTMLAATIANSMHALYTGHGTGDYDGWDEGNWSHRDGLYMKKKGYFGFWCRPSGTDWEYEMSPTIVSLIENGTCHLVVVASVDASANVTIKAGVDHHGDADWHYTSALPITDITKSFYIFVSWESIINPDPEAHTFNIELKILQTDGSDWFMSSDNESITDDVYINEVNDFSLEFGFVQQGGTIYYSQLIVHQGYYITGIHHVMALARQYPVHTSNPIGIDYKTTQLIPAVTGDKYFVNKNIRFEEMAAPALNTTPGKIIWTNLDELSSVNEYNTKHDIIAILPSKSIQPTNEHNSLLIWAADRKLKRMTWTDGYPKVQDEINNAYLIDKYMICLIPNGVAWLSEKSLCLIQDGKFREVTVISTAFQNETGKQSTGLVYHPLWNSIIITVTGTAYIFCLDQDAMFKISGDVTPNKVSKYILHKGEYLFMTATAIYHYVATYLQAAITTKSLTINKPVKIMIICPEGISSTTTPPTTVTFQAVIYDEAGTAYTTATFTVPVNKFFAIPSLQGSLVSLKITAAACDIEAIEVQ